jgi:hypothetical protein
MRLEMFVVNVLLLLMLMRQAAQPLPVPMGSAAATAPSRALSDLTPNDIARIVSDPSALLATAPPCTLPHV